MSVRMLAGTVSLMTRGQIRALNSVRETHPNASGQVLADGTATITIPRLAPLGVSASGRPLYGPAELQSILEPVPATAHRTTSHPDRWWTRGWAA